jgi:Holliday junction resolvase RusA-like endonuclease
MTKTYLIEGDFMPLARHRATKGKLFDAYAHSHLIFTSVLESQHMKERLFKGNVAVKAIFYLDFPDGMGQQRKMGMDNRFHTTRPTLGALMKAVEDICTGLLFEDPAIIVSMLIEKRLSMTPRLELIISEVKDAKRDGEEAKTPQRDDR